jgi:hypothetical protein
VKETLFCGESENRNKSVERLDWFDIDAAILIIAGMKYLSKLL